MPNPATPSPERDRALERAHAALLETYRERERVAAGQPLRPAQLRDKTLRDLFAAADQIPVPVQRLAAWNLLGVYGNIAPGPLRETALRLLDEPIEQAQERFRIAPSPLPRIPGLSGPATWSVGDTPAGLRGQLEFSIQRPFAEVAGALEPTTWPGRAPLFWRQLRRGRPQARRQQDGSLQVELGLSLPGEDVVVGAQVRFLRASDPFGGRLDYDLPASEAVASCRGFVALSKLAGEPGHTRAVFERTVRFRPPARRQSASPLDILAYWLQSDAVSLVLDDPSRAG